MCHFSNATARPRVSAWRGDHGEGRLRLPTTHGQRLKERRGSGGRREHPWMRRSVSSLWTGPFLAGTSGDTIRKQQCGRQQCPSEVPELLRRIKSTV